MWPKALSQLVELAPHVTRLLPLADRYFKDKTGSDDATRETLHAHQTALETRLDAQRAAVTNLSDRLHADLGAITSAQTTQLSNLQRQLTDLGSTQSSQAATLQRQITDLEKHLVTTRADALAAKQATESLEARLARIDATQSRAQTLAIAALALLVALLILIATLSLRTR